MVGAIAVFCVTRYRWRQANDEGETQVIEGDKNDRADFVGTFSVP